MRFELLRQLLAEFQAFVDLVDGAGAEDMPQLTANEIAILRLMLDADLTDASRVRAKNEILADVTPGGRATRAFDRLKQRRLIAATPVGHYLTATGVAAAQLSAESD